MRMLVVGLSMVWGGLLGLAQFLPAAEDAVPVKKIWDRAPHSAFTDLIRFKDRWFCSFREGGRPCLRGRDNPRADLDRWREVGVRGGARVQGCRMRSEALHHP